jgi:hypothetical protein
VEIIDAPNTNFVRGGILMGSTMNLGFGLGKVSAKRNLSTSSKIPIITIRVVGTPWMVYTNPIMTIHVNRSAD